MAYLILMKMNLASSDWVMIAMFIKCIIYGTPYISFVHYKMKSLGTFAVTELSVRKSVGSQTEKKISVGFIPPTPVQEIPQ